MLIHYDIPKINKVLNDFYAATGTRIDLFDNSFMPISYSQHEICSYCQHVQRDAACKKICIRFDKELLQKSKVSQKTQQQLCPFGLYNMAIPILHSGTVLGYLFVGQMKIATAFPAELIAEHSALQNDYASLALFSLPQSKSIATLAEILISHILTENMLKPDSEEILPKAANYIQEHLTEDLSIIKISKAINVSKSVLYKKFQNHVHCTVGEYINKKRVERAVQLLTNTSLSMEDISQKCGFSSGSYFTKIFKQNMGVTPLKFKKNLP